MTLKRRLTARIFGPDLVQLLAWIVAIAMAATFLLIHRTDPAVSVPWFEYVELAVVLAFIAWGASGRASATEDGLAWRLRVPVRMRWSDIEHIELLELRYGRYPIPGPAATVVTPALLMRVTGTARPRLLPGRRHVIAPAASRKWRPGAETLDFARAVVR